MRRRLRNGLLISVGFGVACLICTGNALGSMNINTAWPQELSVHLNVPAEQTLLIVQYRLTVGKYYNMDQLYEVKGLQQEVINKIMQDPEIVLEDRLEPRKRPVRRPEYAPQE
jgi:hypothetical protein